MKKELLSLFSIVIFFIFNYLLPVFKIIDIIHVLVYPPSPSVYYYFDGSMSIGFQIIGLPKNDFQNLLLTVFQIWTIVIYFLVPILILLMLVEPIYSLKEKSNELIENFPKFVGISLQNYYGLIFISLLFLSLGHYILYLLIHFVIIPPSTIIVSPTINRITLIIFIVGWYCLYLSYSTISSKLKKAD